MALLHAVRVALVACALGACALPGAAPIEQARALATRCTDQPPVSRTQEIYALSPDVEPLVVAELSSKLPGATRHQGARLTLLAPPGLTAPYLQRQLPCHQTDVTLGYQPTSPDDPFALPEAWVDIRVLERGSALVVELRAERSESAAHLVERAKQFAARPRP